MQRAEILQRIPDLGRVRVDAKVLDKRGHEQSPLLRGRGDIGPKADPVWPFSDVID
jgi:hypothetical protein